MNELSSFLSGAQAVFMTNVITNLKPYALGLLGSLALIDLVLSTLKNLGDPDTFKKLCFNLLKYGMVLWVIMSFATLAGAIFNSCVKIGGVAASGGGFAVEKVNKYPGDIINQGLDCFMDHFENINNFLPDIKTDINIFSLGKMFHNIIISILTWPMKILFTILIAFLILISFGILAIEVFMILIEFYICAGVSVMFIPFAACKQTSFLSQKAVSVMIGFGIKVIFAVLVVTVAKEQLAKIVMSSRGQLRDLIGIFFTVSGFTILAWQVPKIAMGFLGGSPSQGASGLIGSAMRAGSAVVGVAAGAAKAAGGMYQAAKTGAASGAGGSTGAAGKMASGGDSKAAAGSTSGGGDVVNGSTLAGNSGAGATNSSSGGNGSAPVAAPRGRLSGAIRGMANYAKMSTSFGAGMRDASEKLDWQANNSGGAGRRDASDKTDGKANNTGANLKSRLAGGGRTAGFGGGIGERSQVTREAAATSEMTKSYNNDNYINNDIGKLDDDDEPDNKDKSLNKDKFTKDRLKKQ